MGVGVVALPTHARAELIAPTAVRVAPPAGSTSFGASAVGLGDVDGDGAADIVVGAPSAGRVYVVSGATRTILREIAGPAGPVPNFGLAVAGVGDLDGDRVLDLAVGAPSAVETATGQAFLFSGATGGLLRRLAPASGDPAFGQSLASAPDLSGDGVPDIVVAAPPIGSRAGSVFAFSGTDGAPLWSRSDPAAQSGARGAFGRAVVLSPDVSGDGLADVLVSAPSASSSTQPVTGGGDVITGLLSGVLGVVARVTSVTGVTSTAAGATHVLSGANGAVLRTISDPVPAPGDLFGAAVAPVGDHDADGVVDHLIAESGANQLHLYSGKDGRPIRSNPLPGTVHGPEAIALAQAGDKDGDGREEVWVGVPSARTTYLVDGAGAVLASSPSPSPQGAFGATLARLADGSAGGPDLVVGDPTEPGGGAAYLLTMSRSVAASSEAASEELSLIRAQEQTTTSTTVASTTTTTTTAPTTTTVPTAPNGTGPTATLPKPAAAAATATAAPLPDTGGVDRSSLGVLAMALGLGVITALRRLRAPRRVKRVSGG